MSLRITVLALVAAALSGGASAQIKTWTFSDTTAPGNCAVTTAGAPTTGIGNVRSCADQSTSGPPYNVNISAYGSTNVQTSSTGALTGTTAGYAGSSTNTFAAATVIDHGSGLGFGVGNATEGGSGASSTNGNHAMDSVDGLTDLLMLSFTTSQVLRSVTIGWSGADGDYQVLRYTGGSAPTITGKTAAGLLTDGWVLVTTVDGAGSISTPDVTTPVNLGLASSSYWLITALNTSFGVGGSLGLDAVKVVGVTAGIASVSTPGSLALAALGLFGAGSLRRRIVT